MNGKERLEGLQAHIDKYGLHHVRVPYEYVKDALFYITALEEVVEAAKQLEEGCSWENDHEYLSVDEGLMFNLHRALAKLKEMG